MSILPLNSRLKAKKTQCSRRLSMAKEATELLSYNDSTIRRTVAAGFQDNNYEERIRCQSTTLADFRRQVPRTLCLRRMTRISSPVGMSCGLPFCVCHGGMAIISLTVCSIISVLLTLFCSYNLLLRIFIETSIKRDASFQGKCVDEHAWV